MLFKSLDRIPVVLILYGFIPFLHMNDEVFQKICDVPFDFRCNVNVVAFLQYLHKAASNYDNVNVLNALASGFTFLGRPDLGRSFVEPVRFSLFIILTTL